MMREAIAAVSCLVIAAAGLRNGHFLPCIRYDTPEIIAVDAVGGSDKYLNWVLDSTKGG